jgi:glycine/D-amino acid oxidase-like deaminating enzyme
MSTVTDARALPLAGDCDVLVIGGGAAGVCAAVAAARSGARTVLLERNPFLGGRATASMVLVLDDYTDGQQITVKGLATEYAERLKAVQGAVDIPPEAWAPENRGPESPEYDLWASWGFLYYFVPEPRPLTYAVSFDPEAYKRVSEEMLLEAGVKFSLFTDMLDVVRADSRIVEVVARRRNGLVRLAAKQVIDASGDGDVMAAAGTPFVHGKYMVTLVHRYGGVDIDRWMAFEKQHPGHAKELNREVRSIYGGSWDRWWMRTTLPGVVWVNAPHLTGYDAIDSEDLTEATLEARRRIWKAYEFIRRQLPGWEQCYLIDTCAELGMRQSRLLQGQYVVTKDDVHNGNRFPDSIGMGRNYHMPYRSMVPVDIRNLLVAGRCFSCEPGAQRSAREIPPCMVLGQAAGTAAALAVAQGAAVQDVDVAELQRRLRKDGAYIV